jgi:FixJ family two-component response regulator
MEDRSRVFVVDDDEGMCRALTRLLHSANIEAAVFHSAKDALHAMTISEPDCIVLDIELPDSNALELLEVSRTLHPGVPVVIITAWEDEDLRRKALKSGVIGFFYKPFADEAFLHAIETALARGNKHLNAHDLD